MTQKLAVSKSGTNVLTATDPNDFLFNSDHNTFKIIAEGSFLNQTVSSHPTTFSLAHNQSYTPNFYAHARFPDGKVVMAGEHSIDYTTQPFVSDGYGQFAAEIDATNLYFIFDDNFLTGGTPPYDVDLYYYLFEAAL